MPVFYDQGIQPPMSADQTELPSQTIPACPTVSLIFPVYNEEPNLDALRDRVCAMADALPSYHFEIILVDDHSSDDTRSLALAWSRDDDRVRYIRLARNFGSHAALTAGLHAAGGDCAILLAADLQDPPELIPRLLERWRDGYATVWAVRSAREGVSWSTRLASHLFWCLMRIGSQEATPPAPTDFVLLDRRVIDAFGRVNSRNDSLFATICWLGFKQACIPYDKAARPQGRSGWTFAKRLKLCIDSIVGFSYWPIRAMSVLGLVCAVMGFGMLVYFVWHKLSGRTSVQGWAGLMSAVLTGMGILMVMVGVLGEYLWRVLDEARGRPRYVVEETIQSGTSASRHASDEPRLIHDHAVSVRDERSRVMHPRAGAIMAGASVPNATRHATDGPAPVCGIEQETS